MHEKRNGGLGWIERREENEGLRGVAVVVVVIGLSPLIIPLGAVKGRKGSKDRERERPDTLAGVGAMSLISLI